jgi:hypothetical protein
LEIKPNKLKGNRKAGPGRPRVKKSFSDKLKSDVMKELDKRAKLGDTYGKLLVDCAFNQKEVHSLRGIAMKLIAEVLVVKETKSTVEEKKSPVVYLPEIAPKPKEMDKEEEVRVH